MGRYIGFNCLCKSALFREKAISEYGQKKNLDFTKLRHDRTGYVALVSMFLRILEMFSILEIIWQLYIFFSI